MRALLVWCGSISENPNLQVPWVSISLTYRCVSGHLCLIQFSSKPGCIQKGLP